MQTKKCNKCLVEKPLSGFFAKRPWRKPDQGAKYVRSTCKVCWQAKNLPYHRASIARYPEKDKARRQLIKAVKRGDIIRGECKVCSKPNAHAHHEDYSKPLDVIWLCRQHHEDIHHNRLNKELVK